MRASNSSTSRAVRRRPSTTTCPSRRAGVIHIAGQVGSDAQLQLVEGGLAAQAEQALRNVVEAVEAAGATAADLVKLTMYVTDWTPDQLEELGAGLAAVEGVPRVPASLIGVSILFEPGYRIEIEAVAVA